MVSHPRRHKSLTATEQVAGFVAVAFLKEKKLLEGSGCTLNIATKLLSRQHSKAAVSTDGGSAVSQEADDFILHLENFPSKNKTPALSAARRDAFFPRRLQMHRG